MLLIAFGILVQSAVVLLGLIHLGMGDIFKYKCHKGTKSEREAALLAIHTLMCLELGGSKYV